MVTRIDKGRLSIHNALGRGGWLQRAYSGRNSSADPNVLARTEGGVRVSKTSFVFGTLLFGGLVLIGALHAPAAYAATYSGGSGTSGDPYLISTSEDLVDLANMISSTERMKDVPIWIG